jgi:hypothetical protein
MSKFDSQNFVTKSSKRFKSENEREQYQCTSESGTFWQNSKLGPRCLCCFVQQRARCSVSAY